MIAADSHLIATTIDAPQQDANQQVSLISSRVGHRTRSTPRFSTDFKYGVDAALRRLALLTRLELFSEG